MEKNRKNRNKQEKIKSNIEETRKKGKVRNEQERQEINS